MNELEITQPEENLESTESAERVEDQALEDATHEPGARIEETQTFEQAEVVESALGDAVEAAEQTEGTPVPIPTPEPGEEDDDLQFISGPSRDDLPDGTGILEEPHETLEIAGGLKEPGPASEAEVPEGMEFQPAGDGTVDRNDPGIADPSELSENSGEGDEDDSKEATPINLPGPVPTQVAHNPNDPPPPPDMSGRPELSPDDVKAGVELDHTGPGGNVVDEPDHGPNPITQAALDHTGPGGNVAENPDVPPPPPDLTSQRELIPDDVKQAKTLQPAPDFEDMNTSERSVVEIISKAFADEGYRGTLLTDARSAIAGYTVAEDDQAALGEMTQEAFDFFAAEVEKRFGEAAAGVNEGAQQKILQQVVHSVWRDLNPGGLAYVLAYKIPLKHLNLSRP